MNKNVSDSNLNIDTTAVARGKALPINMDWSWLGRDIVGNVVQVHTHMLPKGKTVFEMEPRCIGYRIKGDCVIFDFDNGTKVRSHGYGWVRYFRIVAETYIGLCHHCGQLSASYNMLDAAYNVASGKWGWRVYKMCQFCYDDSYSCASVPRMSNQLCREGY